MEGLARQIEIEIEMEMDSWQKVTLPCLQRPGIEVFVYSRACLPKV